MPTATAHLPPPASPILVADVRGLRALARRLKRKQRIALDTEAASFHRYVDRVYLVQISSDDETALIDPLAVDDLGPIGALLADPEIETIFHDADYDLRILHRDYGFRGKRVWDTRIAAQLAGESAVGLGALLEKHFGITLSKKLQRADWSRRPLTEAMIAYAAADTAYLPPLRDVLAARLERLGRLSWAEEEFRRLELVRWTQLDQSEGFLRIKGAKALAQRALAILKRLWEWRESTAARLDRAPFRVLGNEALMALARTAPERASELEKIAVVPSSAVHRYGKQLLSAIEAGRQTPKEEWPKVRRAPRRPSDPQVEARYQSLRALRAERAKAVALDPGLLCPNGTLQAIARAAPRNSHDLDQIAELRSWQRESLGKKAILRAAK